MTLFLLVLDQLTVRTAVPGRGLEGGKGDQQRGAAAAIASVQALMRQSGAGVSRTEGWTAKSNGPFGLTICGTVSFW